MKPDKMTVSFVSAAQIRESIKPKPQDHSRTIKELNQKIEQNKYRGSISVLTVHQDVVHMLREAGYKVEYFPACGIGDMDSHLISWKD